MQYIIVALVCIASFFLGILIRFLYSKKADSSKAEEISKKNKELDVKLAEVNKRLESIDVECNDKRAKFEKKLDAQEHDFNQKLKDKQNSFDREKSSRENAIREKENTIKEKERQLRVREEEIEEEKESVSEKKNRIKDKEQQIQEDELRLKKREDDISKIEDEARRKAELILAEADSKVEAELGKVAELSPEQARLEVLSKAEIKAKYEATQINDKILRDAELNAEKRAKKFIVDALGRLSSSIDNSSDTDRQFIVSSNNSVVNLTIENDKLKGSLIGRGGQNIRQLENVLGVDIIIDSTPNLVSISSYDCVRREVATKTIQELLSARYVNPLKISEIAKKNFAIVDELCYERGMRAFEELKLPYYDKAIIKHMGVLSFRTSFKQNVLEHSKEVARIAALIASELGLDSNLALRAGFLHDIGKGISSDEISSHAIAGANLLRSLGESDAVVNAVEAHHNERPSQSLEAQLIQVADAYSAGRPGAREQGEDEFIERSNDIERIAKQHSGVDRAFAVQAGRDIRVFVKPEVLKDNDCKILADAISAEVKAKYNYLGLVRVCVIRESTFENTIIDSIN